MSCDQPPCQFFFENLWNGSELDTYKSYVLTVHEKEIVNAEFAESFL
jgi:hypothetical protein